MIENTALCHVPVGTYFELHGAPPHFSLRVRVFVDREFPHRWIFPMHVEPFIESYSVTYKKPVVTMSAKQQTDCSSKKNLTSLE
jgi:hypothetical protein